MQVSTEPLEQLRQHGLISALDYHFTRWLSRQAAVPSAELELGACLASFWTGNGNVCVNLPVLAGRPLFPSATGGNWQAPDYANWRDSLRQSGVVGWPGDFQPLILDPRGRLYLYRYWQYEQQLRANLLARAEVLESALDEQRLQAELARWFDTADEPDGGVNWQKIAAATAVLRRLCIISGGPGTGKTTTVVKILALLLGQQGQKKQLPRIRLAAPTGKAAARLQEAIREAKQRLDFEPWLNEAIPEEASTIHRLLGAVPDSVYFRHNENNLLPLDVLVVDEASMVDLALMTKLTSALPASARLIMLGDKDQLASVEAGAVLGDICGDSPGFSAPFRRRLAQLTGAALPAVSAASASPMRDCIVLLKHSYRFGADSGIGQLARAVNRGRGPLARRLLGSQRYPDLSWWSIGAKFSERLTQTVAEGFADYLAALRERAEPQTLFDAFNRFRVLCALRRGPFGVEELNRLIERLLYERRLLPVRQPWYPGRPVMITRNDYDLRLYNGDIGLTYEDPDSRQLRVVFQTADGAIRRFPVSRLPSHETVYAMTVHKSQGSEFDQVLLLLPPEGNRVLSRELLYTGITRARKTVTVWGSDSVLQDAVKHRSQRSSGLAEALWETPADD
ncbi:MAG: exodeoxyribonuclease V subunit alpha [Candidatus Competibacteraceae bacterium]|nr:exodeoxyribonuclease V subunit alpha [Candidatus Competibacteraceae bacterium]